MTSRTNGGRPRRVLSVAAIVGLVGAMGTPLVANADDDRYLGQGSAAPESKIMGEDVLGGAEAMPHAYFVEFESRATVQGGTVAAFESQKDAFLADAQAAGVDVEVRAEYSSLWSGLSVTVEDDQLADLAASGTVKAIYPVAVIERPQDLEARPMMGSAVGMTGVDVAQSELGLSGAGIKVGVIDSGIDYDHPDFGGSGTPGGTAFPTERVAYGYDFVGDAYNASPSSGDAYYPYPEPDEDPDDCGGHGTHVAGIVGANGEVTGVAPDAVLGSYRVFGCAGSTGSDIILQALEMALEDGMDVVNLSLGADLMSWSQYPTAVATDAMVAEGVAVFASQGNSQASGLHSSGAPSTGRQTIAVGSVDNFGMDVNYFLDAEGTEVGYVEASGAPSAPTSGTETVVALGEAGSEDAQFCAPATDEQAALIEGNVVLVQRGTCSFHEKAVNAQNAGASGVVLFNNEPGVINPTVEGETPITIPFVSILQEDGERMTAAALADGSTELTWAEGTTSLPNPTGGLMSNFSSFGPDADLWISPDLAAPGGSIYSTYPLEQQPYATLSGTSMASPHAAGMAALMLESDGSLTHADIRTRLQNNAEQLDLSFAPGQGLTELVHLQGAGLSQVDEAILAETTFTPGLIQLGQQISGESSTQSIEVTNTSDTEQTFAISHQDATATSGTANDFDLYVVSAEVAHPESVTVPAGGTATVEVTITSPTLADAMGPVFGGYLLFEGADSSYSVAYGGAAYDLQDVEVMLDMLDEEGNTAVELPAMAAIGDCDIYYGIECVDPEGTVNLVEDGYVYSMTQDDHPMVVIHLEHQVPNMTFEVFEANEDGTAGESLGVVYSQDYLSRAAGRNGFGVWAWDGKYVTDTGARERVESGNYILEVTVTRAQAWNDDREATTESWTSGVFGIAWDGDYGNEDRATVDRVWGQDRFSTASELAHFSFDQDADTVYIANGRNFPDALAGGALAGTEEAPILLTDSDNLPAATRLALRALEPQNIVILGGETVVDADVEARLGDYAGSVERLAGPNRYATAAEISELFDSADAVFLASGLDYPDALAAAAAAGVEDIPVLLTKDSALPNVTAAALEALNPSTIYVTGGDNAVSPSVREAAGAYGEVEVIAGANRYETAEAIATRFFPSPAPHAFLSTGEEFADALAAAPVAAMNNGPVLLTKPERVPNATTAALMELRPQNITITGGYQAVSLEIQQMLEGLIYP